MSNVPQVDAGREPVVIVGSGVAGVSAAGGLRAADYDGRIVLLGEETELPYRRTAVSKEILRGDKDADGIRIKPEAWYADQGIDLVTGVRAERLDIAGRALELTDGSELGYSRVVLATGGRARNPYFAEGSSRVRTLRSLGDLPLPVGPEEPVVVIGAGLIGSEGAAGLRSLGYDVTLLETAALPLPRLLPGAIAERYVALHKTGGVDLQTDVTVVAVEEHDSGVTIRSADGRAWEAGLVLVAVGMEPASELAAEAGLELQHGGISVDWSGRTSAPDVYAAGDVAARPSSHLEGLMLLEHWQGAMNHGTAVGRAVAGDDVRFDEVPWCWSEQYGHNLQVTGWTDGEAVIRGEVDSGDFTAFFVREEILRGAVTLGRPGDVRAARGLIADRARVDAVRLADGDVAVADTLMS